MSMSKKDFIALAGIIQHHNNTVSRGFGGQEFTPDQIEALSDFCRGQNANFMAGRWTDYIAGKCGPSGGRVKC